MRTFKLPMDRTPGSAPPGIPIPPSFTFDSSSYRRSYTGTTSSSPSFSLPPESSSSAHLCDYDFERQRHLRQNQEIIRLCTLKSVQIRQSEAKLSELENENLELRTALRHANRQLNVNIDKLPFLPPREHVREAPPAGDGSGIYSRQYPPKRARAIDSDDRTGMTADRYEQGFGREQEYDADQHGHNFKRQRTQSPEIPSVSKQQLLSKLDQIQVIYQSEHEALCTMMQSFNSTTRLYKNILHLLENEALKPHDNGCREPRSPDAQPSISSLHSWNQPLRNAWSSPETDMPELSDDVTPTAARLAEPPYRPCAALSFSFITSKHSTSKTYQPPMDSRSPAPLTSPKTGIGRYSTLSSRLESSDRLQLSTAEGGKLFRDSATNVNMNMKYPEPPEMPRAIRPVIRDLPRITALPSIDENVTDAPFSPLHEQVSPLIDEHDFVDTPPSPLGDQDSLPLLEPGVSQISQRKGHDSIVGNLRRAHIAETPRTSTAPRPITRESQAAPSYSREASSAFGMNSGGLLDDRSKSLLLSKAFLDKHKSHAPTLCSSSHPVPAEVNRSRSIDDISTAGDDQDSGSPQDNDTNGPHERIATSSRAGVSSTNSTRSNIKRKRTTAARSEQMAPSSTIKSRTAINPQYLKSLTTEQLLRCMSKSLLDQDKSPKLPMSATSASQKYGVSLALSRVHSSSTNITSRSLVASSSRTSIQNQSDTALETSQSSGPGKVKENEASALMPPPAPHPPSAPRPIQTKKSFLPQVKPKQLATTLGKKADEKRNVHHNRTLAENTLNSSTIGHRENDGDDVEEDADGSRNVRKRAAKAPVLYRIPSITKKLFQGDPGTYSLNTPLRPARVPNISLPLPRRHHQATPDKREHLDSSRPSSLHRSGERFV